MIPVLNSSFFGGQISAPKNVGLNPIFRAKISVNDESIRCYVKPMPDYYRNADGSHFLNREITSEALGHVLGKACGMSMPDNAGVIVLERGMIPDSVLSKLDEVTHGHAQDSFLAWFSQDMIYPNLVERLIGDPANDFQSKRIRRIAEKLSKHPDAPALVSFDEWLLNSDRHLGNLLAAAKGKMMLIDQGRIFRLPSWQPGSLGSTDSRCQNTFELMLNTYTPRWSEQLPIKSARSLAYNTFSVAFRSHGSSAARSTLKEMMMEDSDVDTVINYLGGRLDPVQYSKFVELLA
ncbi:hypothetical protein KJF94_07100 [Pseudomonas hormoni]|uniref:HipA-like C-terminal domain-containing protein n=1 Tax=Pseudomonas hormoni TaxID=3093767 RepID=A0ABX8F319_9PSED|nr:hypothetical protein [Pseudomonas hormoni]QVW25333.1 hypothetical protein KJF94_07100 [Pseudomonas hormoni]